MCYILAVLFSALLINLLQTEQIGAPKCTDQLYEYYVALGMPRETQRIDPILITTIKEGIQVEFAFQSVSAVYQATLPHHIEPPIIDYVSFDRPPCLSSIDVVCGGTLLNNVAKNASCTLVDYATVYSAGRTFVYNSEAGGDVSLPSGCTGNVIVRLLGSGLVIDPALEHSFYTYSLAGLPPRSLNLTFKQAIDEYTQSLCLGTTHNIPTGQYQHVCRGVKLGCVVNEAFPSLSASEAIIGLTPQPFYVCRGSVPGYPSSPSLLVWHVDIVSLPNNQTSVDYCISFCDSFTAVCDPASGAPTTCLTATLGTRTQFVTTFANFNASVAVVRYGTAITRITPLNPPNNDPFLADVPCLCGFNIDCYPNGTINTGPVSRLLHINNIPPEVRFLDRNIVISPNVSSVFLSMSPSIDPDNQPNPLTYLWQIYDTPPSPVTIDNPRSVNITVSGDFVPGLYRFIGRVSDGEDTESAILDVRVSNDTIIVALPFSFDVQYIPLKVCPPGCPSACQLPNIADAIKLDGSASSNTNPALSVTYRWTQISGNAITVPFQCDPETVRYFNVEAFFNTDQPIAYFIPQQLGIYTFRLTICNSNGTCVYKDVIVNVRLDFFFPNGTKIDYPDYPTSPSYSIPRISTGPSPFTPSPFPSPSVPTLTRSPNAPPTGTVTLQPTSTAPVNGFPDIPRPIVAPDVFPTLPPASTAEKIALFIAFMGMIAILTLLIGFCAFEELDDNNRSKWDRIKVYQ